MYVCVTRQPWVSSILECRPVYFCMEWLYDLVQLGKCMWGQRALKWSQFHGWVRQDGEGEHCDVGKWNVVLRFRSGWTWHQSGVRWAEPAWSFAGTVDPSVVGSFQDRPSPEISRSSTRRDLTSSLSDYRSSEERHEEDTVGFATYGGCRWFKMV